MQKSILLINIVPLVLLSLALFKFNPANFHPFHPKGTWTPVAAGSALMVWAYAGIESATVPAEEMQTPQRTIRLGTLLGYGLATLIFLLSAVAVIGALPNDVIASSARPLELAVRETLGPWPAVAVSVAAVGASIGVLNGWILMAGRIPFSAAQDGLFFSSFARVHPKFGTPYVALDLWLRDLERDADAVLHSGKHAARRVQLHGAAGEPRDALSRISTTRRRR